MQACTYSILSILDAAESVTVGVDNNTLTEHDHMTLTCAASGGNPETYSYQWWFTPNFGIAEKHVGDEAVLNVEDVEYTDAGRYRCEATNSGGSADSVEEIVVHCKF